MSERAVSSCMITVCRGFEPGRCRFSLVAAYVNCEQNSLLYLVRPFPEGARHGICHTRNARGEPRRGCFYRRIDLDTLELRNEDP